MKSIFRLDYNLFIKQIKNIIFLISLSFTSKRTVIVGIAPLDWRMVFLRFLLKGHRVFYFTSWSDWSGKYYPKKKLNSCHFIRKTWRKFLEEDITGVFSVTNTGLKSLTKHYKIKVSTSVVYHSYKKLETHAIPTEFSDKIKLIYVGRLVKEKGIKELIELIKKLDPTKFSLTIVGAGELKPLVEKNAKEISNIEYKGFISSKKDLWKLFHAHDVQLLFSRKSDRWEELFGMVIIEAMANGVITISTNHSGPKEIIDHNINGFIIPDDSSLIENTKEILENKLSNLEYLKEQAEIKAVKYSAKNISFKWKSLLNE
ncbi:glycosyltransferase [Cellulophaga algicola]|uniref:glycosyltransferase n=1 Tax=Cellulophaga algicola TaxID=59600 RepID=UPI00145D9D22|nr:glycosyltransferase [Cellulophaga algicola]